MEPKPQKIPGIQGAYSQKEKAFLLKIMENSHPANQDTCRRWFSWG